MNLGLTKKVLLAGPAVKEVDFAFDIDNLLNRTYDAYAYSEEYTKYAAKSLEYTYYPSVQIASPRAFYGTVTVKF